MHNIRYCYDDVLRCYNTRPYIYADDGLAVFRIDFPQCANTHILYARVLGMLHISHDRINHRIVVVRYI